MMFKLIANFFNKFFHKQAAENVSEPVLKLGDIILRDTEFYYIHEITDQGCSAYIMHEKRKTEGDICVFVDSHNLYFNRNDHVLMKKIGGYTYFGQANICSTLEGKKNSNNKTYLVFQECTGQYQIFDNAKDAENANRSLKYSQVRKFKSQQEAKAFAGTFVRQQDNQLFKTYASIPTYAFVDGSYNEYKKCGSYGCVFVNNHVVKRMNGKVMQHKLHNVAAELTAAKMAITQALNAKSPTLTIFYDFVGIQDYAVKYMSTRVEDSDPLIADYQRYFAYASRYVDIRFKKVKAHSGCLGNVLADQLAGAYM